jgi:hypothetical protein
MSKKFGISIDTIKSKKKKQAVGVSELVDNFNHQIFFH